MNKTQSTLRIILALLITATISIGASGCNNKDNLSDSDKAFFEDSDSLISEEHTKDSDLADKCDSLQKEINNLKKENKELKKILKGTDNDEKPSNPTNDDEKPSNPGILDELFGNGFNNTTPDNIDKTDKPDETNEVDKPIISTEPNKPSMPNWIDEPNPADKPNITEKADETNANTSNKKESLAIYTLVPVDGFNWKYTLDEDNYKERLYMDMFTYNSADDTKCQNGSVSISTEGVDHAKNILDVVAGYRVCKVLGFDDISCHIYDDNIANNNQFCVDTKYTSENNFSPEYSAYVSDFAEFEAYAYSEEATKLAAKYLDILVSEGYVVKSN